jgi:hypothetical protein
MRYYVVAGNINEYELYKREKRNVNASFKYVYDVDTLRGLNSINGFFIGSFRERSDIEYIIENIFTIKSKMSAMYDYALIQDLPLPFNLVEHIDNKNRIRKIIESLK